MITGHLDDALIPGGTFKLTDQVATLMARTPPPGMPYPHGDIAAVEITAA